MVKGSRAGESAAFLISPQNKSGAGCRSGNAARSRERCARNSPYNQTIMNKVVHAACPHDCPDACGVLITVEDGRAVKIQGDPEHPVTRGFLCAKVAKYLDRVYSPDRVLYPMRRVAPKGPSNRLSERGISELSDKNVRA